MTLTQSELKKWLTYDPKTGIFIWIPRVSTGNLLDVWNNRLAGKQAGSVTKNGYIRINVCKKHYLAHRLAWLYVYGMFPKNLIDHANKIRSDNSIANLSEVTILQNCQNISIQKRNISGYTGITWNKHKNTWTVTFKSTQKTGFKILEEAIDKLNELKQRHGGPS